MKKEYRGVHEKVSGVPTSKSPWAENRRATTTFKYTGMKMGKHCHGFHSRSTQNIIKGYTVIWVVMDRLTKSAHLLPDKAIYTVDNWAQLYVKEILRLHGVPVSIVSDRDPRFTSAFWRKLQKAMGTRLDFSTAFRPQTDGQTERLNQILEDMLRACVMDFTGSWDTKLHLMKFSYSNSFQATIGMTPVKDI